MQGGGVGGDEHEGSKRRKMEVHHVMLEGGVGGGDQRVHGELLLDVALDPGGHEGHHHDVRRGDHADRGVEEGRSFVGGIK